MGSARAYGDVRRCGLPSALGKHLSLATIKEHRMRINTLSVVLAFIVCATPATAQSPPGPFNGLDTGLGNLYRMSAAQTRSIIPENFTG